MQRSGYLTTRRRCVGDGDLVVVKKGETDAPLEAASPVAAFPAELRTLGELAGWSVAAILVTLTGVKIWGGQLEFGLSLPASGLLILTGLGVVVVIWSAHRVIRSTQVVVLVGAAVGFAMLTVLIVLGNPSYGTDEIAFDQYAAQLVLHGMNPYLHSMAPSLAIFHVPDIFRTYLLNGGQVHTLSYPAGSFLLYTPSLLLGMHMQAAVVTDAVAWITGCVVVWSLLPCQAKWVAPLILLADVYVSFTAGGGR